MKKFTFKGVLDGFRSSVSQQARADQEIVETLRPDNFQVAKVGQDERVEEEKPHDSPCAGAPVRRFAVRTFADKPVSGTGPVWCAAVSGFCYESAGAGAAYGPVLWRSGLGRAGGAERRSELSSVVVAAYAPRGGASRRTSDLAARRVTLGCGLLTAGDTRSSDGTPRQKIDVC
ncbi:hypothetical protein FOCC_FOCC007382 [Frankliniella occidentalis]|nr:hypothetical protein FOCC_FOCC007382 [Frankliniella occidentalis]